MNFQSFLWLAFLHSFMGHMKKQKTKQMRFVDIRIMAQKCFQSWAESWPRVSHLLHFALNLGYMGGVHIHREQRLHDLYPLTAPSCYNCQSQGSECIAEWASETNPQTWQKERSKHAGAASIVVVNEACPKTCTRNRWRENTEMKLLIWVGSNKVEWPFLILWIGKLREGLL